MAHRHSRCKSHSFRGQPPLHEVYSEQILEIKNQRQQNFELLESTEEQLKEKREPSRVRNEIEGNLKKFQKAWTKATPHMKKNLIRTVLDGLIFHKDCIDIFYFSDQVSESVANEESVLGSTGANPVDLASWKRAKALENSNQSFKKTKPTHNPKISGWDIVLSGCGGWI